MNTVQLVPLPEKLGSVGDFIGKVLLGSKNIPAHELEKMRQLVTDTGYALSTRPPGFLNSTKGLLFGASKDQLGVLKARIRRGGIFGKGGIVRGDLAMDPAMIEKWRQIRKGDHSFKNYLGLAGHGLGYGAGLAFGPGLPAAALAGTIFGSNTLGDVGAEGATLLGYSLGAPFGLAGGILGGTAASYLGDPMREKGPLPDEAEDLRASGRAVRAALPLAVKSFQPFEAPEPEIYLP